MSFLEVPPASADVQSLYDDGVAQQGFLMNMVHLWAHQPELHRGLFDLVAKAVRGGGLSFRQRALLVVAGASAAGDSYCSLAWGNKLTGVAGADVTTHVLRHEDERLEPSERALVGWARKVARDPNGTRASDVQELRDAGFDDGQIFAITVFLALRLAFATVNDALGALPDDELVVAADPAVRAAVGFGRQPVPARQLAHA